MWSDKIRTQARKRTQLRLGRGPRLSVEFQHYKIVRTIQMWYGHLLSYTPQCWSISWKISSYHFSLTYGRSTGVFIPFFLCFMLPIWYSTGIEAIFFNSDCSSCLCCTPLPAHFDDHRCLGQQNTKHKHSYIASFVQVTYPLLHCSITT